MKKESIDPSKNYFAMSLKLFFKTMTEDQLEIVCHNYIHNWINQELKEHNRQLNKYQQEQKIEYANKMSKTPKGKNASMVVPETTDGPEMTTKLPRFMAPTIGAMSKGYDAPPVEPIDIQTQLRKDTSKKDLMRSNSRAWVPTNPRDQSLEKSFRQKFANPDEASSTSFIQSQFTDGVPRKSVSVTKSSQ